MLQNIRTKDFLLTGMVVGQSESDDKKIFSYNIQMDCGYETTRHRRFLRPLLTDEDITEKFKQSARGNNAPKMSLPTFHNNVDSTVDVIYSADALRRSSRQKARDSSLQAPAPPTNNSIELPNALISAPSTNSSNHTDGNKLKCSNRRNVINSFDADSTEPNCIKRWSSRNQSVLLSSISTSGNLSTSSILSGETADSRENIFAL